MILDAHVHLADQENGIPHGDAGTCIRYMDEAGVDRVIAFPYGGTTLAENERWLRAMEPYRRRIIPYVWLNPLSEQAGEELAYAIDVLGFRGLKLHPLVDQFDAGDMEAMDRIMHEADVRGLHVIVHCTSNETLVDTDKVEALAKRYRNCIIQLAHTGAIYDGNKAIAVAQRNENVYLDTGIASMNCIRRAILQAPEKVLMGCDYPSYTFKNEMVKIRDACELAGRPDAFAMVCGGNAERILRRGDV